MMNWMFYAPPTPLDLNYRLFGVPVRVTPWFWVTSFLLPATSFDRFEFPHHMYVVLLWVACWFVSITVHEMGHALATRAFGGHSLVVLHAFGGYAQSTRGDVASGWRRLLVVLAGPGAGFALAGLLVLSNLSTGWAYESPWLWLAFTFLYYQNLTWGLVNLLPLYPLDGGQALREILYICGHRRPAVPMHLVSVVTAGLLVLLGLTVYVNPNSPVLEWVPYVPGPMFMLFIGLLGYQNWQLYQQHSRSRAWDYDDPDDDRPWLRR